MLKLKQTGKDVHSIGIRMIVACLCCRVVFHGIPMLSILPVKEGHTLLLREESSMDTSFVSEIDLV